MRRVSCCLAALVLLAGCGHDATRAATNGGSTTVEGNEGNEGNGGTEGVDRVARVVDGDTIVVGVGERVRLIGIDTPETVDPRRPVQCFGREASARTKALLPAGTPVRLVFDVDRYDRYGRTLAYVYREPDDLFVNAALVREGYAVAYTVPPDVAHADQFVRLERAARGASRGLWGACR